jgi:hypothetical protein
MKEHLDSWRISLEARKRSPRTVQSYIESGERFIAFCEETDGALHGAGGHPPS